MDYRTKEERISEEMLASSLQNSVNIVISDKEYEFFTEAFMNESYIILSSNSDMYDCLVAGGFFKSKSQAKNSWTKTDKQIEYGFHSFVVGKKQIPLHIFKPILDDL